jgi:hypothetical protein
METSCSACIDVSKNLGAVLSDSFERSETDRLRSLPSYRWHCSFLDVIKASAAGCSFCKFIDYLFLERWYLNEKVPDLPWQNGVPSPVRNRLIALQSLHSSALRSCSVCEKEKARPKSFYCGDCKDPAPAGLIKSSCVCDNMVWQTRVPSYCWICERHVAKFIASCVRAQADHSPQLTGEELELLAHGVIVNFDFDLQWARGQRTHETGWVKLSIRFWRAEWQGGNEESVFRVDCSEGQISTSIKAGRLRLTVIQCWH